MTPGRTTITGLTGALVVASLALGTPVAHASPPECTSGSPTTWTYAGDAAQQCVTPGNRDPSGRCPFGWTTSSAPTGVTTTAAASHSTVDANSDLPVTKITIEYSLDPNFESGILSVPGDPASLPGVVAEIPVAVAQSGSPRPW